MNNTILSYIFIALSIIFLFWSIFKTEETRKNNHKDIKIIILHFIVKYFLKEKFYEYKYFENPNGKRKYFYV